MFNTTHTVTALDRQDGSYYPTPISLALQREAGLLRHDTLSARHLRCANVTVRAALFAFAVLRRMISLRAMSDSYNKTDRCQCTGSGQRIPAGEARDARLGLARVVRAASMSTGVRF